ncbi:MAG: phosphoribosyltransferase [Fervidicoccaceae archaeon]|nr:MAG: phosphoribosyltransferase [Fervidicoccus sp.]
MPKIPVKLVTWDDVVRWSKDLAEKIKTDGYTPDVVVAIARGGVVTARLLCDYLGIIDMLSIKVEHWIETAAHVENATVKYPFEADLSRKRVLLVDDICDTGKSIEVARDYIIRTSKPLEIRTATMQYISPVSKYRPDYFAEEVKEWYWYMYPWNYYEDSVNLVKKILQSDATRSWRISDIEEEFRKSYEIIPPIPIEEIIKEGVRRGVFYYTDGEVKLRAQYLMR